MQEMEKINVAVTDEQLRALKAGVDTGEYATVGEIVREALDDWQAKQKEHGEHLARLRELWRAGKASGSAIPLDRSELLAEARNRVRSAAGKMS